MLRSSNCTIGSADPALTHEASARADPRRSRLRIADVITHAVVLGGLAPELGRAVAMDRGLADHRAVGVVVGVDLARTGGTDRGDRGADRGERREAERQSEFLAHDEVLSSSAGTVPAHRS